MDWSPWIFLGVILALFVVNFIALFITIKKKPVYVVDEAERMRDIEEDSKMVNEYLQEVWDIVTEDDDGRYLGIRMGMLVARVRELKDERDSYKEACE